MANPPAPQFSWLSRRLCQAGRSGASKLACFRHPEGDARASWKVTEIRRCVLSAWSGRAAARDRFAQAVYFSPLISPTYTAAMIEVDRGRFWRSGETITTSCDTTGFGAQGSLVAPQVIDGTLCVGRNFHSKRGFPVFSAYRNRLAHPASKLSRKILSP